MFLPSPSTAGRFESFNTIDTILAQMNEVAEAVHIDDWPRSDLLHLVPSISKDMLTDPSAVTRERCHYTTEQFKDSSAVSARWIWECLVENPDPVPTELPKSYTDEWLKGRTEEQRKDPNFIKERLGKALERYQKSRKFKFAGSLKLDVCRAPDAKVAQEFLVYLMCNTTFPTSGIIGHLSPQRRKEGLGDVAFGDDWLLFVRDNIAVAIDGRGVLSQETIPLAQKIDAMIKKQPAITKDQLQSLRPILSIGASGRKADRSPYVVDYSISVPGGQTIASLYAYVIGADGRSPTEIGSGKIRVFVRGSAAKIRVEAFTTGLLATVVDRDVTLLDEPVGQNMQGQPSK
jgi:hypothetical protein